MSELGRIADVVNNTGDILYNLDGVETVETTMSKGDIIGFVLLIIIGVIVILAISASMYASAMVDHKEEKYSCKMLVKYLGGLKLFRNMKRATIFGKIVFSIPILIVILLSAFAFFIGFMGDIVTLCVTFFNRYIKKLVLRMIFKKELPITQG